MSQIDIFDMKVIYDNYKCNSDTTRVVMICTGYG
jgi:hypothetical protein